MVMPHNIANSEEYLALCREKVSVLREENFQAERKYAISATDEVIFCWQPDGSLSVQLRPWETEKTALHSLVFPQEELFRLLASEKAER